MSRKISRREFLKSTAGIALATGAISAFQSIESELSAEEPEKKPDLSVVKSASSEKGVISAIEAIGGIGKFVKSNDVVIIKPNMAFPNPPDWGSTTSPEIVATVARLCLDAGAKSVLVIDNPMDRPEQCLQRTGVADEIKKLGSDKVKIMMATEQRDYVDVKLEKAKSLEKTNVHKLLLRANAFINIPVAKSHSATTVSFGMKNLMGLIWDRGYLHQNIDLHQGIADLCTFIKPNLIIMDATRALVTKGPTGPGMTIKPEIIIAGTDQVAVDSYALSLSSWNGRTYSPGDVKHIALANALKVGEMNLDKLNIKKMEV
ncbi:DUF362 domain-containing protein [Patescibacteria group bacterium]|nr:DUF362 domain-containing protein [Patescibacteria group bacterium]